MTGSLASEVAVRERIRAILAGDATTVGAQTVLTARLIAPDGCALASVRETAAPDAVIEAADRLSAALRERLGCVRLLSSRILTRVVALYIV